MTCVRTRSLVSACVWISQDACGGVVRVAFICSGIGDVCGIDVDTREMRNQDYRFNRCDRHQDRCRPGFSSGHGLHCGLAIPEIVRIDGRTMMLPCSVGAGYWRDWLCFFRALQLGDANKVVPIDKSSAALSIVLAALLLHESMNTANVAGVALIAVGTLMMVEKKETDGTKTGASWLWFAVGSAVFASLTAILEQGWN